jgi:hypothetical protein
MDVYTCMLICLQYNGHNGISLENNTIYIYIYIYIYNYFNIQSI